MPGLFVSLSADTSVASGAAIPFNNEIWSEQWSWGGSGSLIIPRTGTYMVSSSWLRAAPAGAETTTINVRTLGVMTVGQDRYASTSAAIRGTIGGLLRATAGDQLDVLVTQVSGNPVTIQAGSNLRVARIGPDRWTG